MPELPAVFDSVRISDLIHHTSGITDYTHLCDGSSASAARALRFIRSRRSLDFVPGVRFEYSNSNYLLLALLAERVRGKPFADLIRTEVLSPAGMRSAYLRSSVPFREDEGVAWAYTATEGGGWTLAASDPCDALSGDGGLVASVRDLAAWAAYLDRNLARPDSEFAELFESGTHGLPGAKSFEYGMGWQLSSDLQGPYVQHAGGWLEYRSLFRYRPRKHSWVILLLNRDDRDVYALAEELEFRGQSRKPVKSGHAALPDSVDTFALPRAEYTW
jgi:CubicO group peptidase (beta-lactamase class C family)